MKFIISTDHCDQDNRPPRPSGKTIEIIFGNVWRGPRGDITDAEREAWNAKETPEGAQAKADSAQQAASDTAAASLKAHTDDSNIHKTSEQIRADIVEDDIPATIARTTDVETKNADTLAKAKEYTDGAVAAKADAQTVADALAGKVDKAEGKDFMTSAEREKLSGIEAGANAYTHPESHPADMITDTVDKVVMTSAERNKLAGVEAGANAYTLPVASASALGGVKAGSNVTIAEDGTLSAAAEPYELPKASAATLGGIKIGNNLTIREDGTLDAAGGGTVAVSPDSGNTLEQRENGLFVPAGSGGGSRSGDGILVLPHVAPERDADGNLTNSAAFVDAWGGIFSEYLAAPDSHALYMETEAGEGLMLRIPCNVMNIGSDADMVQWLISGFTVVNVPMSSSEPVSCKATVMAAVICNAAGEMQSLAMYAGEGIAAADGSPNLLGSDDAVIIDLGLDTGAMDEAKLKAAVQPVLAKLMTPTPPRVIVKCNAFYINGTFQTVGSQFIITAYGAHPYTVGDVNNTYIIRAGVIGTVANGAITTVQGGYVGQELTTTEAMNAALAGKAALIPFSLTEQLVPGEFWDGKQVYQRTFKGTLPTTVTEGTWLCPLTPGTLVDIVQVWGWVQQGNWNDPHMVPNSMVDVLSKGLYGACIIYNQALAGKSFNLTIKYTKA